MFGKGIKRIVDTDEVFNFVEKLQTSPAQTPRMTEAQRGMTPEAGVAATSPEITPEQTATVDHLRSRR